MADDDQHFLKFGELERIDKSFRHLNVKSDPLRECVAAFIVNVNRSISLTEFPALVLGFAEFAEWVLRHPHTLPSRNAQTGEVVNVPVFKPPLDDPEMYREQSLSAGFESLAFWSSSYPDIPMGMRAVLYAQLVSTWTAFETLAGDLWVRAVNARPVSLGSNVFSGDASVTFDLLKDFNFHIRDRLGDVAYLKERVKFDNFGKLVEAYGDTFKLPPGDKKARTSPNLDDIFKRHRVKLRTVSFVRNLLVHQAGTVDERFRRNMRDCDPMFAALDEDSDLPIDGAKVVELVNPVLQCACELVGFVDGWLGQFPE